MLGWILAGVLLVCLIAYAGIDYMSKGDELKALRVLSTENKHLQRYIDEHITKNDPDTFFAATFEAVGVDSIEHSLHHMISRAQTEILIVSPWVKEGAWERISPRVSEFCAHGGVVKVFIRGTYDDFVRGACDRCVVDEMQRCGVVVTCVPQLHAKLYVIDRREALITSANLTRSGLDFGYEAGVWTCNPVIVNEVLSFINDLAA